MLLVNKYIKGVAIGAISGGMANSSLWKIPTMGLGGGVSSEVMGGEFKDGFKVALVTAAGAYLYSSIASYDSTLESGEEYSKDDWDKYKYKEEFGVTPQSGNQ